MTLHTIINPKKDLRAKPLTEGGDVIETIKDLVEFTIVMCVCSDRRRAISRSRGSRGGEISISKITKYILRDDTLSKCYLMLCSNRRKKKRPTDCVGNALFIIRAQVYQLLREDTPAGKILKLLAIKGYLTPNEREVLCEYAVKEYGKAVTAGYVIKDRY